MNSDLIYPSFAPTDPPMTRLNSFMLDILLTNCAYNIVLGFIPSFVALVCCHGKHM